MGIDNQIEAIDALLADERLQNIIVEYNENMQKHQNAGFNIFNLISDKWHYENFHSDIIAVFLNRFERHGEGDKFLTILLKLLQKHKPELNICLDHFKHTLEIKREKHRIDILIQDEESKKAIIIENKINNAVDQDEQLLTYFNKVKGYDVVAIVYLRLDKNKYPETDGWKHKDKEMIKERLICLNAYDGSENDFYNGWIQPCIKATGNDSRIILTQYSKLIHKIGGFIMGKTLLEGLDEVFLGDKGKFERAMLFAKIMQDDYASLIADKIKNKFINDTYPFENVTTQEHKTTFSFWAFDNIKLRIDIEVELSQDKDHFTYLLRFWETNHSANGTKNMRKILKIVKCLEQFQDNADNNEVELKQHFKFPYEEEELYQFIKDFKEKLKGVVSLNS